MDTSFVFVGLDAQHKRRRQALKLARGGDEFDRQAALLHLGEIRGTLPDQLDSLRSQFYSQIMEREYAKPYQAKNAADASGYIENIVGQGEALAINRAGIIGELRPYLEANGHQLVHTYLAGYPRGEDVEKVLHRCWQLPDVSTESAYESFNVQRVDVPSGRKDYTALLGVSAAAAEDGSVVLLQHTSNVGMMLREAGKVVLIVGVDKIVHSKAEAIFQARSMGAFGLENVILNLSLPDSIEQALVFEKLPLEDVEAEIYVILLDNGRSELAQRGEFAQLLTCISCQACAVQCPTYDYFNSQLGNTPKQYLWSYLLGLNPSLEMCIGCGMCLAQCPLNIDLPRLITIARNERLTGWKEAIPNRALNDAWWIMKGAHLSAPLTNGLLKNKVARKVIERIIGFEQDAWVPSAQKRTFMRWFRRRKRQREQV